MNDRYELNKNLAQMLKGGVIMDVTTPEQAEIAQKAGACAVMALERIPADIRAAGGVSRMSDPKMIKGIQAAVSIPVMAKVRIGHIAEAQILQAIEIDYIDESEVLNHMRDRLADYQEEYGDLYNLEATPAESTTYRLAKHDVAQYPDIITANEDGTPYYTNSSHLPVGYTEDIFEALDVQDELQTLYTSGTVFHAFLGEKLPDWKAAASLVRKIAENYTLPYYTLSPTYSICKNHGYLAGEHFTCPDCGGKTEVYSRITGYYRPVQNWNDGKSQEFKDRKVYNIGASRLTRQGPAKTSEAPACAECAPAGAQRALLFTTKTCPNCKVADSLLQKAALPYEKIDAEENASLALEYGVRQAPTLVVLDGAQAQRHANVANIKKYIETVKAQ